MATPAGHSGNGVQAEPLVNGAKDILLSPPDIQNWRDDLGDRGIGRLMVEGGSTVHTQFLAAGLADEIQMAVAPLFVGDPGAPRFVKPSWAFIR